MSALDPAWERLAARPPESVAVGGAELRRGSRVRVVPRADADLALRGLAGRTARVESIEQDVGGEILLVVVLDDDPGRDLGRGRFPGHRFFVAPDEIEPLGGTAPRILVAGIGNVFLGDDGFGVEVVRHLAGRLPPEVDVVDFGIRGLDLVYALQDGYDAAILVDALPLDGAEPGTLAVVRPEVPEVPEEDGATLDPHGMHPARVLALARGLGPLPREVIVVGCQPGELPGEEDGWSESDMELGAPVRASVERAVELVTELVDGFRSRGSFEMEPDPGSAGEGSRT